MGLERYGRNPACISGVSAMDMRGLHNAQVGKHSALFENILLIVLTMK